MASDDKIIGTFSDFAKGKPENLTNSGVCTGCGSCCSNLLPIMSLGEILSVRDEAERRKISPTHDPMYFVANAPKTNLVDMQCPFLDNSKHMDKCRIYDKRPKICKEYKCDQMTRNLGADRIVLVRETIFNEDGSVASRKTVRERYEQCPTVSQYTHIVLSAISRWK